MTWDIVTAPSAAERANAEHRPSIQFAPTVVRATNGPAPAVGLVGGF